MNYIIILFLTCLPVLNAFETAYPILITNKVNVSYHYEYIVPDNIVDNVFDKYVDWKLLDVFGIDLYCRYPNEAHFCRNEVNLLGVGYVYQCAIPRYDDWDVLGHPKHDIVTDRYYFMPKPNSIYKSPTSVYNGDMGKTINITRKNIFLTGNACIFNGQQGISYIVPHKEFKDNEVEKYRNILNMVSTFAP